MSELPRCITPPPSARIFVIRTEFIAALEHHNQLHPDNQFGDVTCAAALLSVLEYKTNLEIEARRKQIEYVRKVDKPLRPKVSAHTWIKLSIPAWKRETVNLFSDRKISTALFVLELAGLIVRRSNPWNAWDKAPQYKLRIAALQRLVTTAAKPVRRNASLKNLADKQRDRSCKNGVSTPPKAAIDTAEGEHRSGDLMPDSVPSLSELSSQSDSNQVSSSEAAPTPHPDDDEIEKCFADYAALYGVMPGSLRPELFTEARRLGVETTRRKLATLKPKTNPWPFALTCLKNEPIPLPPSHKNLSAGYEWAFRGRSLLEEDGSRYLVGEFAEFIRQ